MAAQELFVVLNARRRRRRCPEEEAPSTKLRAGQRQRQRRQQQQLYSRKASLTGVSALSSLWPWRRTETQSPSSLSMSKF
ncbi:hypothetical protein ABVT39_011680 [Epinephelus coioides]